MEVVLLSPPGSVGVDSPLPSGSGPGCLHGVGREKSCDISESVAGCTFICVWLEDVVMIYI